jgi:hypothetical protein
LDGPVRITLRTKPRGREGGQRQNEKKNKKEERFLFHFILLGDPSPISNQMVTVKYPRLEEVYNALWLFTWQYIISEAYHLASLKKKFHMDNEKIHNRLEGKLT